MAEFRTHYENLQVTESASPEVIRGAYRYLSQKWHPDKNPDSRAEAERVSRLLNEAYAVLSDERRRKEHDLEIRSEREKNGRFATKDIDAAAGMHRRAERKARIEKTSNEYFLAYDQPLILRALRKIFAVSALVCAFFTIGLLLQILLGTKIDSGYFALFALGAIASFMGFVKCSPTHAFVVCPMCRTSNRVPAHSFMNCRCGECRHEFEIQT